jgi:hypothetical protein
MSERLFTLGEAQALVPKVKPMLAQVRLVYAELRAAAALVGAMVEKHGEAAIDKPDHPDRERYWQLVGRTRDLEQKLESLLDEIRFLGVEVKDLEQGLVDFRARREGKTVYLCWKLGEERIRYWHTLDTGFAGRKPLEELEPQKG